MHQTAQRRRLEHTTFAFTCRVQLLKAIAAPVQGLSTSAAAKAQALVE